MKSRCSWTKLSWLVLLGLAIALSGMTCSGTASKPIPITTGDGGWEHIGKLPQASWLNSLFFVDSKTGWAVGLDGIILKTTNGGVTWSCQNSGVPGENLISVWFSDANNGWVVGLSFPSRVQKTTQKSGVILRTTDGGVTWQAQESPGHVPLYSICFTDPKTGWASGYSDGWCTVMKTTDGGVTWAVISKAPHSGGDLRISFADAEHGCICGRDGIIRTTDGGKTWIKPTKIPDGQLSSVYFIDQNNGWACGYRNGHGLMLQTTDGGDTWSRQATDLSVKLRSVCFADSRNGWASGDCGSIIRTSNGGAAWSICQTGTTASLSSVRFADSQNGWAAGSDGLTMRTIDGGRTWTSPESGIKPSPVYGAFVDAKTGWIIGRAYNSFASPDGGHTWERRPEQGDYIYKTTDGGLTWTQQRPSSGERLQSLCFADASHGWAVGCGGMVVSTSNGGETWSQQMTGTTMDLDRARFVDVMHGWVLGSDNTDRKNPQCSILRTTDGGKTWEALSTGTVSPITDIWFADSKTPKGQTESSVCLGWEVGANGLLMKTADGGNSWKRKFTGVAKALKGVFFLDSKVGWVVGEDGLIAKTGDGGETWTQQQSGTDEPWERVRFVDANTGWVSSYRHAVMTTDGGRTWTAMNLGRGPVYDICAVDPDHVWMPGLSFLRTATSGLPGCVWAKKQPDGKAANFGHLVVTETTADGLYAVHPDSKIGMRFRIKNSKANVGDYLYVHGTVASDGNEKVIYADSIDVITAGWGHVTEGNGEKQAQQQ